MAIEMKVPAVGESITEVTVATWNKKEGDHVKLDEVLCELESDKATFELPAEAEGVLHIVAKEGDVLPIGAVICTIEAGGATASVKVADAAPAAARLLLSLREGSRPLRKWLEADAAPAAIFLSGPEGGLSAAEEDAALAALEAAVG